MFQFYFCSFVLQLFAMAPTLPKLPLTGLSMYASLSFQFLPLPIFHKKKSFSIFSLSFLPFSYQLSWLNGFPLSNKFLFFSHVFLNKKVTAIVKESPVPSIEINWINERSTPVYPAENFTVWKKVYDRFELEPLVGPPTYKV